MPGVPPDTFRQLRDKIKGVFRRKKKIAPVDPNALIVDAPVDTTAAVSGAVPAQDGAGPAEPAPVAGTQTENPPNPAQTSNPTHSRHDIAVATDSDTETEAPPSQPKPAGPKPTRNRATVARGVDGPVIPPSLLSN